jgi:peptidoglycan hydrolase CwlO-like protein
VIAATRIQCNDLSSQIDRCNAELNSLRYNVDRTNQYAIDNYNSKVGTVNQYIQTYRIRVAEMNTKIDEYNTILDGMKSYAQLHRRF